MPGHKGNGPLGIEGLDITEVYGADSLFEASGIIKESEDNASRIFGAHTLYSTEGSSLSVRAMVYLTMLYAKNTGREPRILAARNCHRSFLSALALTDCEVEWLEPDPLAPFLCAGDSTAAFLGYLNGTQESELPIALYVTSPDYLGNIQSIKALAELCHERGMLLLVDNAHGAYLSFMGEDMHPCSLGADMCCDSAHKTLPALTGAAYLHIANDAPEILHSEAKRAMALFASTSPSYLILASLDLLNEMLENGYVDKLRDFAVTVNNFKQMLTNYGFTVVGNEPMKITVYAKSAGYTGEELAQLLRENGIECEFSDPDYVTLMPSPSGELDLYLAASVFGKIEQRHDEAAELVLDVSPSVLCPVRKISVREALFALSEEVNADESLGRIASDTALACPPAVPILIPGEYIDEDAISAFRYYGIKKVRVVKE